MATEYKFYVPENRNSSPWIIVSVIESFKHEIFELSKEEIKKRMAGKRKQKSRKIKHRRKKNWKNICKRKVWNDPYNCQEKKIWKTKGLKKIKNSKNKDRDTRKRHKRFNTTRDQKVLKVNSETTEVR